VYTKLLEVDAAFDKETEKIRRIPRELRAKEMEAGNPNLLMKNPTLSSGRRAFGKEAKEVARGGSTGIKSL